MKPPFNTNSSIAILGLGVEGEAILNFLKKRGYKNITIFDEKKKEEGIQNKFKDLEKFDVIFRSPGIHKDHHEIKKARRKGVEITSATKLFFDLCPCKIIGITGTKGKGTTSTLIYKILKEAGKDAYLGGNIGECPLNFIDKLNKDSITVLELSSFQLHDLKKSPQIAVILKTTSEHLDYHKDLEEYLSAKESIVRHQTKNDAVIANIDYPYHLRYLILTPAEKFLISAKSRVENGAYIDKGSIISVKNKEIEKVCDINEVGLIGPHNLENILAAVSVCNYLEIPISNIQKVIKEFKGLPHRIEFIRELNGIEFYNDSFSTTPETCIAAIQSFEKPVVLIAGGSEKHSDYTNLGKEILIRKNLKTVVLMGETAKRIEEAILKSKKGKKGRIPLKIIRAKTYAEAFFAAYANAEKGSIILLSPASASFDMFENYKHRGEIFRKWVESL